MQSTSVVIRALNVVVVLYAYSTLVDDYEGSY